MKTCYAYFAARHNKDDDRLIVSTAVYTEYNGNRPFAVAVDEVVSWSDSTYVRTIQAFASTLNYIYSWQDRLIAAGFECVALVTNNRSIFKAIAYDDCRYDAAYGSACEPFRSGGSKELKIQVALANLCEYNLAYKYCDKAYAENGIKFTNRGVTVMTKEENEQIKADAKETAVKAAEAEENTLSVADLLARDEALSNVKVSGFVENFE